MAKLIILKFERGDFKNGFEVTLSIAEDNSDHLTLSTSIPGQFPPSVTIPDLYQKWYSTYQKLTDLFPRITTQKPRAFNTDNNLAQCCQSANALKKALKDWLNSENKAFQKLREKIIEKIPNNQEAIRVLIQTEDTLLKKLPWQEWDLFANTYTKADIALSTLQFDRPANKPQNKTKAKILAILGNSQGIDLETDRQALENLKGTETTFLSEPTRSEISDELWEQNWDMLFFSGHSSSQGETGRIFINRTTSLTIHDLKSGLSTAIENGLQLAIFNSCDGLKIADDLADLHIPQVIVMREPVPDQVAQRFLQIFLKAFSGGKSLYLAVREARERLFEQGLDEKYPGASWLPVICQNPSVKPPHYHDWLNHDRPQKPVQTALAQDTGQTKNLSKAIDIAVEATPDSIPKENDTLTENAPPKNTMPKEEKMQNATLQIVLIYKRRAQPDEQLLTVLEQQLTKAGHKVFIDRHLKIGEEWEKQITHEIQNADAVVILLSPTAVYSEMLAYEVEIAHKKGLENSGKPRLFPIRINFEGPLPQDLSNMLGNLQYALWQNHDDDHALLETLLERLTSPSVPQPKYELEMVGGAIPLDSKFYIERQEDKDFQNAIARRDSIVLLKGARQVGKTSLLARGIQSARDNGIQVLFTDFQTLTKAQLQNLETFFIAIGEMLADQLDLEVYPQTFKKWIPNRAPNINFENYFQRKILANPDKPVLWAIDEADRLLSCHFSDDVFALFRSWHNKRATEPNNPCSRLTIAIAYATEPYLFIEDLNQSPFNVGTKLFLNDFTIEQVNDLNQRYGSPLRNETELQRFYQLVAGQPYLVRCGLNDIVSHNLRLEDFLKQANDDEGAFGDHLRRIVRLLTHNSQLLNVMRGVLRGEPCPDYESFHRLRSAGILKGHAKDDIRLRCEIYATYLKEHLL